jgi:hypothetical protein
MTLRTFSTLVSVSLILAAAAACSAEDGVNHRAGISGAAPGAHKDADALPQGGDEPTGGQASDGVTPPADEPTPPAPTDDQKTTDDGKKDPDDQTPPDDATMPPSTQDASKITTSVGVRNFRQVNQTMAALTGVPATDATVSTAFASLATQLPDGNDLRAFVGSHQVAIAKLAVEYCDRMIETPALAAAAVPGFSFAAAPSAAFNAAGKALIAKSLTERFWGKGVGTMTEDAQPMVAAMIDDVLKGKDMTSPQVTKNVVKGACTAVLAAGPAMLL